MPIKFIGKLEDVEGYEGKKGFGANIVVSAKVGKKTKRLEFRTSNKEQAEQLEDLLDKNVEFEVFLDQNSFGLRLADILSFGEVKKVA